MAVGRPPVLVSIGAGVPAEGSQNLDPVCDFLSHGIVEAAVLFEPQPDRAEQLRRRFGGIAGVRVVEAAVGGDQDALTLWRVKPEHRALISSETFDIEGGIDWTSAHRDQLMSIVQWALQVEEPRAAELIEPISVASVDANAILGELRPKRIDYLQVDVEGLDAEVLAGLDLERLQPRAIRWESRLLSEAARTPLHARLEALGYRIRRTTALDETAVLLASPGDVA